MDRLRGWLDVLLTAFRRGRAERELEEEFRFHIAKEAEKLVASGVDPVEARRRAHVRFGGVERTKQEMRDAGRLRWLEDLVLDVRHGLRTLGKTPVLAVVTVLSLGLGIGASTAVFTIGNAFLFMDPGGVEEPAGLVAVYTSSGDGRLYGETSFPDYLDIAGSSSVLEGAAAYRYGVLNAGVDGHRDRILTELVTGNYFSVLGTRPALGRFFAADETVLGQARRVMVLSYRAWQDRFGGADVVGRTWRLDGEVFTVIGVAPEGQAGRFLRVDVDGWIPLGIPGGTYHSTPEELAERGDRDYQVIARLRPGARLEDAKAEMSVLAGRLHAAYPEVWEGSRGEPLVLTVLTEKDSRVPPDARVAMTGAAVLLLVGSFMLLLLVCANVGGVLLARAYRRSRELAVRSSLGASRGRLIRLLLTESVLLAGVGGTLGVYLAYVISRYFRNVRLPADIPLRFDIVLDHRVVIFAAVVSVGAALAAGLAPALQASRPDLMTAMKTDLIAGHGGRRSRLRSFLVVFQVAAAVLILVSAGLTFRSLRAGLAADPGMDLGGVAVTWVSPPEAGLDAEALRQYFLEIGDRLRARPEVDRVALSRTAEAYPMMDGAALLQLDLGEEEQPRVRFNAVTPGYLEMFGLRVIRGRSIADTDGPGAPQVAVVNEAFLRRYMPDASGPGGRIRVARWLDFDQATPRPPGTLEIVGVVADRAFPGEVAVPRVWTSFLQDDPARAIVHVRGRGTAASLVPLLRAIETRPDDVTLIDPTSYRDLLDVRFMAHRIFAGITGLAGLFALLLAVMGVYGVVSFGVSRRLREMAIRQAMGARRGQVVRSLLAGGMRMTALGLVIGLATAVPLARLVQDVLFGLNPADPVALGGPVLALGLAAAVASLVPTRRLLRTAPMQVLRDE